MMHVHAVLFCSVLLLECRGLVVGRYPIQGFEPNVKTGIRHFLTNLLKKIWVWMPHVAKRVYQKSNPVRGMAVYLLAKILPLPLLSGFCIFRPCVKRYTVPDSEKVKEPKWRSLWEHKNLNVEVVQITWQKINISPRQRIQWLCGWKSLTWTPVTN